MAALSPAAVLTRALPVAIVTVILFPGWAWTTADEARVRSAPLRRMDSGSSGFSVTVTEAGRNVARDLGL